MKLQNRWKLKGKYLIYYGLRNFPYTNKNKIRLSRRQQKIVSLQYIPDDCKEIKGLVEQGIIVKDCQLKSTPKSLDEAVFCKECAANNFIIAGLEFNKNGLCPMCAAKQRDKDLVSVLPVKNFIPRAKNSRFDVAIFYTGGKDSTYLLYHLAKVLDLRVLALTWEIPFMSPSAKKSIENAKKQFKNVEFVSRTIAAQDLNALYKKLLSLQNNTCACPSLAYAVFYPILCQERVPYLVLGNEPVQMKQLYYNNIAPRIAYRFQNFKGVHIFLNILRAFALKKPLKKGQREMLLLIKQLAFGDSLLKRMAGYENQLVQNVCAAMDQIPNLKSTLKKAVKFSDRRGCMPCLVHLDLNTLNNNKIYDWQRVKDLISLQCGWVAPQDKNKNLHTSCCVEKAKDYSQFLRFYNMQTTMIPFSALEISLASSCGSISRDDAIKEIKESGLSLTPPKEYDLMFLCQGCPMELKHE